MIKILDCTLRDGGYYNNWDFDNTLVSNYIEAMINSKIDVIEIGFRSLPGNSFKGPYYYSTEYFLKKIKIPKSIKLAVMINANEWICESNDATINLISKYFVKSSKSPLDLIRIAININNYQDAKILVHALKKFGYNIGLNLMQAHGKTEKAYKDIARTIKSWNSVDVLYFADSLGNMSPNEIKFICGSLKSEWKSKLGIHTHNNKNLALINTMTAINNGVEWCDSTINGMGRGAGNLETENLLIEAVNDNLHKGQFKYLNKTLNDFKILKSILKWGPNYLYHFAANKNIHPTYVQTLFQDNKYSNSEISEILKKLAKVKSSSYSEEKLKEIIFDNNKYEFKGSWNATNWLKNENVLIIGGGESVGKYKEAIIDFIKLKNLKVIFLNLNSYLSSSLGVATVISHESRILFEFEKYKNLKHKIILPLSRFKDQIGDNLNKENVFDYGLSIEKNSFEVLPYGCVIGTSLALAYALCIVTQAKAEKLYLAGFDGYPLTDLRNQQINQLFDQYSNLKNSIPIEAVTPTRYNIRHGSVFSPYSNVPTFALIIPARYKSSRFPGKPLADLCGKSVIERVSSQCVKAVGRENVYVATDDQKIKTHCEERNIQVIMTSSNCLTGTDRLVEVSTKLKKDIYINVQGDEPLVKVNDIKKVLQSAIKFPDKIYNGMSDILDQDDYFNSNVPKVVTDNNGKLLYMSRSPIPGNKEKKFVAKRQKKQICIYSFPFNSLIDFGKLNKKTMNENEEDIEILRFLDVGYEVNMIDLEGSYIAIDTPSDLEKAKIYLKRKNSK